MGIDVNRTISLTFLIAGALAGAAGLVVALYYGQTWFQFGFQFGLLSFTAAVLGGIGNLTGATLGGLVIGIIARHVRPLPRGEVDERDRVLDPDPRPGLPSDGPAVRTRVGARLMTQLVQPRSRPRFDPFRGMERKRRDTIIVIGLFILAIVYPLIYRNLEAAFPFIPWPGTAVLIQCATFGILALGLNIVMGFAGLLDLGYVAFYAIGAYTTAILASPHFGIHISWWIVVWIAVAFAAVSGILLGAPTLKLRGDYLAIVTLGFGEIVRIIFRNLGDFTLALPAFLGRRHPHRPERQPDRRQRGDQPDRPTHDTHRRSVGRCDRVLQSERDRVLLPDRRAPGDHVLRVHAAARLEARSGMDGDPRGRDGRRRDGHQHGHDASSSRSPSARASPGSPARSRARTRPRSSPRASTSPSRSSSS